MQRKFFASIVLTTALAGGSTFAQTPTPAAAPAASPVQAVDPAAIQALKDMGAHLQSLKRFGVEVDMTGERVLSDGQKLQHSASADLQIDRPNKFRAAMHSARSERELIFDGKKVTLYTPGLKSYSTVEYSGTIAELIDRLETQYGVELPASDLFVWGTPQAPLDGIESAMIAGQDIIDGTLCDHYAFRQGSIDWELWLTTGEKPLPRKLVITNRSDDARPQSVTLFGWDLRPKTKSSTFSFAPPKDAKLAEIVPLKKK
ncbi:DUF2092 domain-containing protein [Variovorax sp. HJSM1_2]|uniref:DUF2092 domain-containing protein n=1 Tax=Variovorax sp. HJSM1_2 TaxID=3366263 RepID=UPI003BD08A16